MKTIPSHGRNITPAPRCSGERVEVRDEGANAEARFRPVFGVVAALAIIVLSCSCQTRAAAQDFDRPVAPYPGSYPGGVYPPASGAPYGMYGGYGYPQYDHASTYEEGLLRGRAALLRAYGESNYWNAQALNYAQEAYRQYLNNRKKTLETYCDLAQINYDARERSQSPRPTREDLVRYATDGLPKLLTASEFDGVFGVVRWPEVLRRPDFASARTMIDRLLPDYCQRNLNASSDVGRDLSQSVGELESKLKREIDTVSPMEYVAAKKFLESLKYEIGRKTATARVARR